MKHLYLSGKRGAGKYTIVDDSTFKNYGHLKWHLSDMGYAVRRTGNVTTRLHRIVVDAPKGMVVDHLDGNPLNNQAKNLRICTQAENMQNMKKAKNYCYSKSNNVWIVRYRNKWYGSYKTEDEAKKALKLAKSGVEYVTRTKKNKYLPMYIYKNGKNYIVRVRVDNKRKSIGNYVTIADAKVALTKWQGENNNG